MVLNLTEVNPAIRPTAQEALEHRWVGNYDIYNEQTVRESALNLHKPTNITPYKAGISKELMTRVHNKNTLTEIPIKNQSNSNAQRSKNRNSTEFPSVTNLLASLRIADSTITPRAEPKAASKQQDSNIPKEYKFLF